MALIKSAAELLKDIPAEQKKKVGRPRSNRKCSRPYCGGKHKANDLCERHRYAQYRWGNPDHVWVRPRRGQGPCACPDHLGERK